MELNIRIDWSELDLYGHINNVMVFKYFQAARIQYCGHLGLGTLAEPGKTGFIVAASHCDFRKKILYPGNLKVVSHVTHVGNSSFRLDHVIYNDAGAVAAEGYDVIVVYDYVIDAKAPIDTGLRRKIERLEAGEQV